MGNNNSIICCITEIKIQIQTTDCQQIQIQTTTSCRGAEVNQDDSDSDAPNGPWRHTAKGPYTCEQIKHQKVLENG